MVNIKLLFTILDEGYDKKVKKILNEFGINVKFVLNANGTASPSLLDYFGLIETEKEVFISIIPDYLSLDILNKLQNTFKLKEIGTGIAFTIPITSSNKFLSEGFKDNLERNDIVEKDIKHHLVITILSEGFLEQVMTVAKKAGCSGGTVIKGRTLSDNKKAKILGFNIEPERDIVINIVSSKNKTKVMEEITKEVGTKTDGKGICFSLPVDNTLGFDLK